MKNFYDSKNPAASVVLSKKLSAVQTVVDNGLLAIGELADPTTTVLSTGNGTLISLEDSSEFYGNRVTLKFVDTGGQSIQRLLGMSLDDALDRAKVEDTTGYFILSYGVGRGRVNWSPPMWYYLNEVDYSVNTDGMDLTILKFSPTPARSVIRTSNQASMYSREEDLLFATIDKNNNYRVEDTDTLSKSVKRLVERYARNQYGLPVTFLTKLENPGIDTWPIKLPTRQLIGQYLDMAITENPYQSDLRYTEFESGAFADFRSNKESRVFASNNWAKEMQGDSEIIQIYNTYLKDTLKKKLNKLGIVTHVERPRAIDVRLASNEFLKESTKGEDSFENWGRKLDPDGAFMNVEPTYKIVRSGQNPETLVYRFLTNFFTNLKIAAPSHVPLLEAAKPLLINDVEELDILKGLGIITDPDSFRKEALEEGSSIPEPEEAKSAIERLKDRRDARRSKSKESEQNIKEPKDGPHVLLGDKAHITAIMLILGRGLDIIQSSVNLLKFDATVKQPAISAFRNNIYWGLEGDLQSLRDQRDEMLGFKEKTSPGGVNKDKYVKYIKDYLESQMKTYSKAGLTAYTYSEQDYIDVAHGMYEKLISEDNEALSDFYVATGSDTSDLADFLHFYFNYTMLGTILGEATVLPDFSISRSNIPQPVQVNIDRNPTPYSQETDAVVKSIHTGPYRLLGYKHSIDNKSAITKLALAKLTLGEIMG